MNENLIPTAFPVETPETIRARILARMNLGRLPTDPSYVGVTPGDPLSDFAGMLALEGDEIYDRMPEAIVAASPTTAIGAFLDAWATVFRLQRKAAAKAGGVQRFTGANGTVVPSGFVVSTEAPTATAAPIEFVTTAGGTISGGSVDLPIEAVEAGTAGNVPAGSITLIVTPGLSVTTTNPAKITGGDDLESDERLRVRVNRKLQGTGGGGNVDHYVDIVLNEPGVGYATVIANDGGTGNVRVVVTDVNNDPVSSALLNRLQALIDPTYPAAGQGAGLATIGARVLVATPAPEVVSVSAGITTLPGYSIAGGGGTTRLQERIEAAVRAYIDELAPGQDVVAHRVVAAILSVDGVYNVTEPTLAGVSGDKAIAADKVAVMGPVTLS